ncbi:TlyA family rRNA (cytidine-2'-O)-methyltransferase [Campylobacter sp. MIT 99-7217]|uniref:23S rRNA (cytidine-2'-O)-methyltransferase TlyA n=1 Tax=Campylobacter sp. MIT 99-7217 TaxID=535091 RepID=UPI0011590F53|nr:TlyA family RNA methyltransferase [Campylobacter sp. MIT 99-7217]TQR33872.1 TlyA family rRNA (cytidine-2'-O)-methyltransferase [Campylobacter sp. MIT 99-7217]
MRYDLFVSKKLKISKNQALELIKNEALSLNLRHFKPSFNIKNYAKSLFAKDFSQEELLSLKELNLKLKTKLYVSRAALKLKAFLEEIKIEVKNKACLDIGSSTGGFVQVLLEKEVKSVLALDVGKNQLHSSLRQDPRIRVAENTDLRAFESKEKFELITCDVSFISLLNLIFYIDELASKDIILLFKPQFEVGKEAKRDKKGVLKDEKAILKARAKFEEECAKTGWVLEHCEISAIKGKEGNAEYFYHYAKK